MLRRRPQRRSPLDLPVAPDVHPHVLAEGTADPQRTATPLTIAAKITSTPRVWCAQVSAHGLAVLGSASATGTHEHNHGLGLRRAQNAAVHAISGFELVKKMDSTIGDITLRANATTIGSQKALTAIIGHPTRDQIENNQAFFRGAFFKFKAGFIHPAKANTYQIREIYLFKFQKISEPAPALVKTIEGLLGTPLIKKVVDAAFGYMITPLMTALGNVGKAATHMISYVIPSTTDYCFEIKDYRNVNALYRFHGVEHKDSISLKEILKLVSGLRAIFKQAEEFVSEVMGVHKGIEDLNNYTDELVEYFAQGLETAVSKEFAETFRMIWRKIKEDKVVNFVLAPGSDWAPFQFADQLPSHKVADLTGPAKRTSVDAAMRTAVHLDFGGYVPNSWTKYKAHAQIISRFWLKRGIFGVGFSNGSFMLARGPYGGDIAVGVGNVVTD